jgi:hypothetical protein
LKLLAGNDEKLFRYLAALYTQTSCNYAAEALFPVDKEIEVYALIPYRESINFTKKTDGSFEVEVRIRIDLKDLDTGENAKKFSSNAAVYRLEKVRGRWICQNPVYRL